MIQERHLMKLITIFDTPDMPIEVRLAVVRPSPIIASLGRELPPDCQEYRFEEGLPPLSSPSHHDQACALAHRRDSPG